MHSLPADPLPTVDPTSVQHAITASADPQAALELMKSHWSPRGTITHELTKLERALLKASPFTRLNNTVIYRFATNGFPENQELITALKGTITWKLTWQLSTADGVHIFTLPRRATP